MPRAICLADRERGRRSRFTDRPNRKAGHVPTGIFTSSPIFFKETSFGSDDLQWLGGPNACGPPPLQSHHAPALLIHRFHIKRLYHPSTSNACTPPPTHIQLLHRPSTTFECTCPTYPNTIPVLPSHSNRLHTPTHSHPVPVPSIHSNSLQNPASIAREGALSRFQKRMHAIHVRRWDTPGQPATNAGTSITRACTLLLPPDVKHPHRKGILRMALPGKLHIRVRSSSAPFEQLHRPSLPASHG